MPDYTFQLHFKVYFEAGKVFKMQCEFHFSVESNQYHKLYKTMPADKLSRTCMFTFVSVKVLHATEISVYKESVFKLSYRIEYYKITKNIPLCNSKNVFVQKINK